MKIYFEKWFDPYSTDDLEKMNYVDTNNEEEELRELHGDGFVDQLEEIIGDEPVFDSKPIKIIMTPMGVVPIYEHSLSSKTFKFFSGHTDFPITKRVAKTIEDTNGVEILDFFTNYRFRVGIGKAFQSRLVLKSIQDRVYKKLKEGGIKEKAQNIITEWTPSYSGEKYNM